MKTCVTCNVTRATEEFNNRKVALDGKANTCKVCSRKQSKKYTDANQDKITAYKLLNVLNKKASGKAYYQANKDKLKAARVEYLAANSTPIAIKRKEHYNLNKASELAQQKEYYANNKEKFFRAAAKRRGALINATPSWYGELDEFVVEEAYNLSHKLTVMHKIKFHVDHIIPLQGVTVSGFHVWNNIQVLTAYANLSKGNKLLPQYEWQAVVKIDT